MATQSRRTFQISLVMLCMIAGVVLGYQLLEYWMQRSTPEYEHQCTELSLSHKWNEVAVLAEKWSKVDPSSADAWLFRGKAAEALKQWEEVTHYLDRVPRQDSRASGALLRKSIIEFENLNRPFAGVKTCDELLEIEPRALIAHKQTIFFFAMTLQRAEMVRRIRRAIKLHRESPESYAFLLSASWLYPASLYRNNSRWLESDPENETFQVARAMQIYVSQAKSDPSRAIEFEHIPSIEQMFDKYPHNQELLAYFMNNGITDGDLDRVQTLLKSAPQAMVDTDARFWRARAWCEDANGDLEGCEKSLRKAFSLDPYWWAIHYQLHDMLRRRARVDESNKFYKIYTISKELSTEITNLNQSFDNLNEEKFCQPMLELANLIEDDEVADVLRTRLSAL